jgi:hypothetical protein
MDLSAEEKPSESSPQRSSWPVVESVLSFLRQLSGFFTLTEEERLQAGIVLGDERREE